MRRPLNISYDNTYLDVKDDAANVGGGVATIVVAAPKVVAFVSVDAGGSKIASSKKNDC